jgi:hypothetical protein
VALAHGMSPSQAPQPRTATRWLRRLLQDGGPILTDTVTQYNNSQNFSQTKFWDGAAWQIVNAVVDGNLLVSGTIGATKIAANAVTAYSDSSWRCRRYEDHGDNARCDPSLAGHSAD